MLVEATFDDPPSYKRGIRVRLELEYSGCFLFFGKLTFHSAMSNSIATLGAPVSRETLLLLGPLMAGSLVNFMLFGISIVQLYSYSIQFAKDKRLIQFSVYTVFALDIFQSVVVWTLAWHAFCSGWGRIVALTYPGWTFSAVPAVSGIVSAWVQIFYAWRIYMMVNWKIIPIIIILLALAQSAAALSITISFIPFKSILKLHVLFRRTIVWLGGAALTDVIISVSMVYIFYSAKKHALGRTEKILNRLIRSTVETGLLTSLWAILELALFLSLPTTNIHVFFALTLSKLYVIAFITSLNSRNIAACQQDSTKRETWIGLSHSTVST